MWLNSCYVSSIVQVLSLSELLYVVVFMQPGQGLSSPCDLHDIIDWVICYHVFPVLVCIVMFAMFYVGFLTILLLDEIIVLKIAPCLLCSSVVFLVVVSFW
jgi:hypothetical protein